MYDEKQAKVHVAELCAAIKRFNWPMYFHTQTANMAGFPGVAELYNALKQKQLDVRLFAVHLTCVWHRWHF